MKKTTKYGKNNFESRPGWPLPVIFGLLWLDKGPQPIKITYFTTKSPNKYCVKQEKVTLKKQ